MSDTETTVVASEAPPLEPCPLCRPGGNIPNAETIEAMRQGENGEVTRWESLDDLIAWYETEI